ncbi:hypothetical protein BC826DRAFT_1169415 [Russula brevipes]|nr:hypothetical protein BC826DRAFT_1169415 [Russula brevipes]
MSTLTGIATSVPVGIVKNVNDRSAGETVHKHISGEFGGRRGKRTEGATREGKRRWRRTRPETEGWETITRDEGDPKPEDARRPGRVSERPQIKRVRLEERGLAEWVDNEVGRNVRVCGSAGRVSSYVNQGSRSCIVKEGVVGCQYVPRKDAWIVGDDPSVINRNSCPMVSLVSVEEVVASQSGRGRRETERRWKGTNMEPREEVIQGGRMEENVEGCNEMWTEEPA